MILRVAILVSGSGTNMENLVKKMQAKELQAEPIVIIGDRSPIASKERAQKLGIAYVELDRKTFAHKIDFEKAIQAKLEENKIEWILLAGFMRILSDEFVLKNWGRIINIHPSYLPAFPGAHGIRDAYEAKVRETGVTVHFVDTGVDSGKVILQRKVAIEPKDTLEMLEKRIHDEEYRIYPDALDRVFKGEIRVPAKK